MPAVLTIVCYLHVNAVAGNPQHFSLRDFEGAGGFDVSCCSSFVIIGLPMLIIHKQGAMFSEDCVIVSW